MTSPYDPYRTAGSTDDRTWRQSATSRMLAFVAPAVMTVVVVGFVSMLGGAWSGWFLWAFVAVAAWGLVSTVRETLRTAHRVTLRRDGTLELARPIGTARIRLEQIRAMRVSRFEEGRRDRPIRVLTDQGDYCVTRGIEDLEGLVEVLRERNPRIELPGIS